jgi:hypothetical protein
MKTANQDTSTEKLQDCQVNIEWYVCFSQWSTRMWVEETKKCNYHKISIWMHSVYYGPVYGSS